MNLLFSIFTSDILPIFVVAGIGFLLASKLQTNAKTLAHVVFYALSPCLVFKMLVTSEITGSQVGRMALFGVVFTALIGLLARITGGLLRLPRAELSAFLLVVMFS